MDYSRLHGIQEGQRGTRGNRCGSFVWIHMRHDVNCNACCLFSSLLHAIAGDHIFSVHGRLASSHMHRCIAATHARRDCSTPKTVDTSRGDFFKGRSTRNFAVFEGSSKSPEPYQQMSSGVCGKNNISCKLVSSSSYLVFCARRSCCATVAFDRLLSGEVSSRG
jgi:hypothetical protein